MFFFSFLSQRSSITDKTHARSNLQSNTSHTLRWIEHRKHKSAKETPVFCVSHLMQTSTITILQFHSFCHPEKFCFGHYAPLMSHYSGFEDVGDFTCHIPSCHSVIQPVKTALSSPLFCKCVLWVHRSLSNGF